MHVCACQQPSLTVSHVVSLTVPKTAPAGSNPFEDDEEDGVEETAVEQDATVNHTVVNKEEIKTLVNRRKHSPAAFSVSTFAQWIAVGVASHAFSLYRLLFLPISLFFSSSGVMLLWLCMVIEWHCIQSSCVSVS